MGDAAGFPYEGLKPKYVKEPKWGFIGRWGMTSDDFQQAHLTYRALKASRGSLPRFRSEMAEKLCLWFICLPPGIGFATLRSCFKLLLGFQSPKSGVLSSGNGPLPRAAVLGWELAGNLDMHDWVDVSTTTTHTGREVQIAAQALATTMEALKSKPELSNEKLYRLWSSQSEDSGWVSLIKHIKESKDVSELLQRTGQDPERGIGGFSYHTLSVAFWVALQYRSDFGGGTSTILRCGGDTDSAAAVFGALSVAMGAILPHKACPILDWPIAKEPSFSRFGYNILTTFTILFYYLPIRLFKL